VREDPLWKVREDPLWEVREDPLLGAWELGSFLWSVRGSFLGSVTRILSEKEEKDPFWDLWLNHITELWEELWEKKKELFFPLCLIKILSDKKYQRIRFPFRFNTYCISVSTSCNTGQIVKLQRYRWKGIVPCLRAF
jgi:hypothetical protein